MNSIQSVLEVLEKRLQEKVVDSATEEKLESLKRELTFKDDTIRNLEQDRKAQIQMIECLQKDCEQVVTAKEEWLNVMRSFKESEEKI